MGGEGELLLLLVASYVCLEARIATSRACAEWVLDGLSATGLLAGLG